MVNAIFTENTGFTPPIINKRRKAKQFAEGIIRVYRIPSEWTEEDFKYWWCPETDKEHKVIRPARISRNDKELFFPLEAEKRNQIMNSGRTSVLSYIGSPSGSTTQWSQYLAIGTGAITATSPTDTSLANEVFRKAPASFSVNGTQVDINVQLGTTDAQVAMSNVGLFGNGATATLGSGSLYTHALFSYSKGLYAVAIDYIINLL